MEAPGLFHVWVSGAESKESDRGLGFQGQAVGEGLG